MHDNQDSNRIALKARCEPKLRFTSLAHHITKERVWENLNQIPAKSAAGVDGQTVTGGRKESFEEWIAKSDAAICPTARDIERRRYGVSISRSPEKQEMRPLGVPTVADRALQRSASQVRYRPSTSRTFCRARSVAVLAGEPTTRWQRSMSELLAGKSSGFWRADLKNFFGSLSHEWMLPFRGAPSGEISV